MAKSIKATKSIVEPMVKFEGDNKQHAIDVLFNGDASALPLIKSVGYMKVPSSNNYVSFVMTTQGKEVLKIEVDEPNLRGIAEVTAKISFVNMFTQDE